ncbi:uncharacterized protein LOC111681197 [Lucilia cuprina]|uniref:uncharacterized protein LOC111681197 n=1 Tax=Lucilia cuprina TaxID=7375 RepID=UPI001F055208|nr:uncharacterized protein LOC111681197 [Lucilia cuprina]
MYNKSLIKICNKTNNIKMTSTPMNTHFKQAAVRKTTATSVLIATTTTSSSLSSATMTLTTPHHQQQQQQQQKRQQLLPLSWPSLLSCSHFVLLQVILPLILFVHQMPSVLAGSCREAQLCCNGRDSSCVVQKAPINAIIEDLSDKPCYCDHACLKLGDCCSDFKDHCGGKCKKKGFICKFEMKKFGRFKHYVTRYI